MDILVSVERGVIQVQLGESVYVGLSMFRPSLHAPDTQTGLGRDQYHRSFPGGEGGAGSTRKECAMQPSRTNALPFNLNSDENREARAVFLRTTQQSILPSSGGGGGDGGGSSNNNVTPASTQTSVGPVPATNRSFWDFLASSDDEEEDGAGSHVGAAGTVKSPAEAVGAATSAAPGAGATAVQAGAFEFSDDDEFDEYFPIATTAATAVVAPAARLTYQKSVDSCGPLLESGHRNPSVPSQGDGASSSTSSSPRGSASKRRRKENIGEPAPGWTRPLPRRTNGHGDSDSSSSKEDARAQKPGHGTNASDSCRSFRGERRHHSDACGRWSPRSVSPGGGGCISNGSSRGGGGSDTDDDFGGCGGGVGGDRKHKVRDASGGRSHEMQVDFDSDSGSKCDGGQAKLRDEEDEEEDDSDELDGEWLIPTLSNPPFEDPDMRPLVLTNEAGGQRAEVPASVNRYLKDYQRQGVSTFLLPSPFGYIFRSRALSLRCDVLALVGAVGPFYLLRRLFQTERSVFNTVAVCVLFPIYSGHQTIHLAVCVGSSAGVTQY